MGTGKMKGERSAPTIYRCLRERMAQAPLREWKIRLRFVWNDCVKVFRPYASRLHPPTAMKPVGRRMSEYLHHGLFVFAAVTEICTTLCRTTDTLDIGRWRSEVHPAAAAPTAIWHGWFRATNIGSAVISLSTGEKSRELSFSRPMA